MRSLFLLALLACGQTPAPASAVDFLSPEALRTEVTLLASDAFAGRGTTEPGADLAAAHIAEVFATAGLSPLPGQGSYAVAYTAYRQGWDTHQTALSFTQGDRTGAAEPGESFRPFPFSDAGEATAEVVFAGYGITAAERDWDDYANIDVTGKIVLVFRHTPEEDDEQSPWKEGRHGLFFEKALNAQKHGAIGMMLVTDALHHQAADDFRMAPDLQLPFPKAPPEATPDEPPFLAVHIAPRIATELLNGFASDLSALQTDCDAGKPVQRELAHTQVTLKLTRQTHPEELHPVNVIAYLEGTDANLKDEWVVIGGHYDHLGAFEGPGDTVFNGADDNASGTTGVLALARKYAAEGPQKRSLVFAAFSGEEMGLLGSQAAVGGRVLPAAKVRFMLNLDMIGRSDNHSVTLMGDGYGTGIRAAAETALNAIDLPIRFSGQDYEGNSDHAPFYNADVPFAFLSAGLHDDYHQLSDHADKLDYTQMSSILRLGHGLTQQIASGAVTPRFVHHINWLGAQIDLVEQPRSLVAQITSVVPKSRAAMAGLQPDDVLRKIGDNTLDDATQVGEAFREITPGSEVRITFDRGNTRTTVDIERAKPGFLGVNLGSITDEMRQTYGLGTTVGVRITRVSENSPASNAGLLPDDTLISLRGEPVGMANLSRLLTRIGAGELVSVTVLRDGQRVKLPLTLGERPSRD